MSELRIDGLSKQYPGTSALDGISAAFESGKVNALIGKNGSGKSTLVKIINGAELPSGGRVFLDGEELHLSSPREAFDRGIVTVYQELSVIMGMNVAENIFLGRYPMKGRRIDWPETYRMTGALLEDMGIAIDPREMLYNLSMWQCQMIEIAKAMSANPRVLLLDEPTSSLAQAETRILFDLIRRLREKDVIILYISHRLQELWEIADTCTVLRDGVLIGQREMAQLSHADTLGMMFGDTHTQRRPPDLAHSDEVALEVRGLCRGGKCRDISFQLHRGEVLGIAGMLGSGRSEMLRCIFGIDPMDDGEILVAGERIASISPIEMKRRGLGLTPEDRKNEGLVQILSIGENLCMASLPATTRRGLVRGELVRGMVDRQVSDLSIKVASTELPVSSLSGGNQQKVVVGNWLNTAPCVMLFDEPSRGIDVKAKQQIFQIIWELSRKGISSIVVSSELEELLDVCHRILVLRYGEITGELRPEETSVEQLYAYCMGGGAQ